MANNRSGFYRTRGIFDTTNLKVVLYIGTASSTFDTGGVTSSSLLFAKEEWRTDNLIKFPFPLLYHEQFEFNKWLGF
jgi:hypothetical protein